MLKATEITEEDRVLMTQYNISTETKTIFFAEGYKYDKLKDALKYAMLAAERDRVSGNE